VPLEPPTRSEIDEWWQGIIEGRVTREAAHAWAEPLMFAEYSTQPDLMVMSALQSLHGFDMTFDPPDRNVIRHGPPGEYYRTIDEIAADYKRWRSKCEEVDRDPDGWRQRARERAEQVIAAERGDRE
jgi:hypothetical protein